MKNVENHGLTIKKNSRTKNRKKFGLFKIIVSILKNEKINSYT